MPSSTQIKLKNVIRAFPELNFKEGKAHAWDPVHRCITHTRGESLEAISGLLHEIAHAILEHARFRHDIELLKMERDAWAKAIELAHDKFGINIDKDHAEDCLDSYRDWLYKRSLCPRCRLTGFQVELNSYSCPHCLIDWKVPTSRLCSVKRKILN
jgi:hypothetical protein